MVTQARLEPYLHTLQIGAGETLIRQGETADAMYFLTKGTIASYVAQANAPMLQVLTAGPGTTVGEVGMLYTGVRTASVVTETECEALALTTEAFDRMAHTDPALAALLHRFIIREVASKLADTTRLLAMQAQ